MSCQDCALAHSFCNSSSIPGDSGFRYVRCMSSVVANAFLCYEDDVADEYRMFGYVELERFELLGEDGDGIRGYNPNRCIGWKPK